MLGATIYQILMAVAFEKKGETLLFRVLIAGAIISSCYHAAFVGTLLIKKRLEEIEKTLRQLNNAQQEANNKNNVNLK